MKKTAMNFTTHLLVAPYYFQAAKLCIYNIEKADFIGKMSINLVPIFSQMATNFGLK
jgi:hypothetical protein